MLDYDDDDPPPEVGYSEVHWWFLTHWAEWCMRWARSLGFLVLLVLPLSAHDLPGIPPENLAWYQNAETNPDSTPRTIHGWVKCCNHAEVIDAKYIIRPDGKDGWRWNDKGEIKDIPLDIIHWTESAPDNKPTLFVYQEVMTCFYPPQGGGLMKQESDATHKKRVLAQIKVEERKRDTHPKKDRGFKRHYSRRRYRFDTYLPWESSHDRL